MKCEHHTRLADRAFLQVMNLLVLGQGTGSFCTLCPYTALRQHQRGENPQDKQTAWTAPETLAGSAAQPVLSHVLCYCSKYINTRLQHMWKCESEDHSTL